MKAGKGWFHVRHPVCTMKFFSQIDSSFKRKEERGGEGRMAVKISAIDSYLPSAQVSIRANQQGNKTFKYIDKFHIRFVMVHNDRC